LLHDDRRLPVHDDDDTHDDDHAHNDDDDDADGGDDNHHLDPDTAADHDCGDGRGDHDGCDNCRSDADRGNDHGHDGRVADNGSGRDDRPDGSREACRRDKDKAGRPCGGEVGGREASSGGTPEASDFHTVITTAEPKEVLEERHAVPPASGTDYPKVDALHRTPRPAEVNRTQGDLSCM
jgi:hypothetical protein